MRFWSRHQSFAGWERPPESSPVEETQPPVVPGYITEGLIGVGSVGEVWAARSVHTGQRVALKRLRARATKAERDRLRREGELLAAFTHPHVIALRGLRSDAAGLVLVLDLAATSLSAVLTRSGPLPAEQVVGVMAPVADALAAAHDHGLLHGDVSPGNVLLRADGYPLLADLGTAQLIGREARATGSKVPTSIFATPGFVDPALNRGAQVTAATDVYSLAAVTASALVGRVLSDTPEAVQQWANLAHNLAVPPMLVASVCAALVAAPDDRMNAAAFAAQLRAATPSSPIALGDHVIAEGEFPARRSEPLTIPVTRDVRPAGEACGSPDDRVNRRGCGSRRWQTLVRLVRRLAVIGAIATVLVAGGVAWAALDTDQGAERVAEAQNQQLSAAAREWSAVVNRLDAARNRAFATGRADELGEVYLPDSPMSHTDKEQIEALRNINMVAVGVRHQFSDIRLIEQNNNDATVQLTERLQSHSVVRLGSVQENGVLPEPTLVRAVDRSKKRGVTMRLHKTDGQWRIAVVTPR